MFNREMNDERRQNVIAPLDLFQGKQSLSMSLKRGVSLITVLLFMLVATIAATATYKWITSEGKSSASRMLQREAYQSAVAGIENTRAWMTYHANDVGALIKQFKDSQLPIKLNDRLTAQLRADQKYDVWLTGVNTEQSTYKLKILSSGEARNGTRHSEVAIFNVDGLYQVKIPKITHHADIDFDYAYFGGSYNGAGNVNVTSAVVNGNWNGNPQTVTRNFIVTGNVTLSGNGVNIGQSACVGGDLTTNNGGIKANDLYVGGNFATTMDITNNAYFEHDVSLGSTGADNNATYNMYVGGNVTLNGKLTTSQQEKTSLINGNLCVSNSGMVVSSGTNYTFTVGTDVWMPGNINLWYGDGGLNCTCVYEDWYTGEHGNCDDEPSHILKSRSCAVPATTANNESYYQRIVLGNSTASNVYIKTAHPYSDYSGLVSKKYSEGGRKYCPSNKRFTLLGSTNWDDNGGRNTHYTKNEGGAYNVCGELSLVEEKSDTRTYSCGVNKTCSGEFVDYKDWWDSWTTQQKSGIFASVNTGDNKYYIFNAADNFLSFFNDDAHRIQGWRVYNKVDNTPEVTHQSGFEAIPIHIDDNRNFDKYFLKDNANRALVGSYMFGNVRYYDPVADENNFYNYTNSKATGSPYCYNGGGDDGKYRPTCKVNPWFTSLGTVKSTAGQTKITCADDAKTTCLNILGSETTGCDNSKYKVDDVLSTGYNNFSSYANYGCASTIKTYGSQYVKSPGGNYDLTGYEEDEDGNPILTKPVYTDVGEGNGEYILESDFVKLMNDCYKHLYYDDDGARRNDSLYNDFLVVEVTADENDFSPSGTLNGKFIIIMNGAVYTQFPPVVDDGYVFLYLKDGASTLKGTSGSAISNYFIYTLADIQNGLQFNMNGTIYASAATCAGIGALQSSTITYSQDVIDELTAAGIICASNSSGTCSAPTPGTGSESEEEEHLTFGTDSYYISMAPQLGITLESQYENRETIPSGENQATLNPSFIVLPRVIYMPRDPYGYLSDYVNILPLNGSAAKKADVTLSCDKNLPISSKLYSGTALNEGLYTCSASLNGVSNPFWVMVKGLDRTTPMVSFVEGSQEMQSTGTAKVHAVIPAHSQEITITVSCPAEPTGWSYTLSNSGQRSGTTCTWTLPHSDVALSNFEMFSVATSGATSGTLAFHLQPGQGYNTGNTTAELHVSSTATIVRIDADADDIDTYCESHADECPAEGHRGQDWPACGSDESWVVPSVYSGVNSTNNSWSINVGGSGTVRLEEDADFDDCVVIIPTTGEKTSYSLSDLVATQTYQLKASAKKKKKTIKVGFNGDVGNGNHPVLSVAVGSRNLTCEYDDVSSNNPMVCPFDVFTGESIQISINKENSNNENFRYWKCENGSTGSSCPTTDLVTGSSFGTAFTIQDNQATVFAHFGKPDSYCFFDEFKNATETCAGDGKDEYCIDDCDGVCESATVVGNGAAIKWHLMEGALSDIVNDYGYIHTTKALNKITDAEERVPVKVLSTVHAGVYGTLKALISVPRVTTRYNNTALNVAKSGFLLHSNSTGTEFLMLNAYENLDGNLALRLCVNGQSTSCLEGIPESGSGINAKVTNSNMVMISTSFVVGEKLRVSAYTDNYYGNPTEYTYLFDLTSLSESYANRDHEFVGFSMADPNFKIYGIGWKSEDYSSECHDTYPTVKCSFAAKAVNGVIPTDTDVEPWLGHSGWYDRKTCEPQYYYIGPDACGNSPSSETTCSAGYYKFSSSDPSYLGQHGYKDANKNDVKTAKAWLRCYLNNTEEIAWNSTNAAERAHCGPFWTGKFTPCTDHASLITAQDNKTLRVSETETFAFFNDSKTINLRDASLTITIDNTNGYDVDVWLYSPSTGSNLELNYSDTVRISGNVGTFDVVNAFATSPVGFDPEHVKGIVFRNLGTEAVGLTSVLSNCGNAIEISSCDAVYNETALNWEVHADVVNAKNVTSYTFTANVNSSQVFSETSVEATNDSRFSTKPGVNPNETSISYKHADNPFQHQGKSYEISVSATGNGGTKTRQCSVSPDPISEIYCTASKVSDISSGAAWPSFGFKFTGCPLAGCDYDVYLDDMDTPLGNECGAGSEPCSGENIESSDEYIYKSKYGNAPGTCTTSGGCVHTYKVVNKSDSRYPYNACVKTFKEGKKNVPELELECPEPMTGVLTGTSSIAVSVPVSGCNDDCTYSFEGGTATAVTSSTIELPITRESTAGLKEYTLTVNRTGEVAEETCTISVTYVEPLELECGPIADLTGKTPGNTITVTPHTVNCSNNSCEYRITGGDNPSFTGSNYDGGDASFTDAGASGDDVEYNLVISRDGLTGTCPFKVSYTSGGSGGGLDCYFIYNVDSSPVTGSVSSKTALQFCVGVATTGMTAVLKGKHFSSNNQDEDFTQELHPGTSNPDCHYFLAPSTDDSYTYTLTVDGKNICNTTPTLTVKSVSDGCIAFMGGVGNYDKNCYNSGLKNMAANTCYTLNPERDSGTQWPNDDASVTYWWVTTTCK